MRYNWQQNDWPDFRYDTSVIGPALRKFDELAGVASGMWIALPKEMQTEAVVNLMIAEAMKTSAIEGEMFSREDVMSSVRNRLRLQPPSPETNDQGAKGIAELMVDVRESYAEPLTEDMLFAWHRKLMSGNTKIRAGTWRTGSDPIQVVSGRLDHPTIHFEGPPSKQVPSEMSRFLTWLNTSQNEQNKVEPIVRSAIAHLHFLSIHPFEDGNGRIGRAISEKSIAQGLGRPALLSLSLEIEAHRKDYYSTLQTAQRSNEITPWLSYFSNLVVNAQQHANDQIKFVIWQTRFFKEFEDRLNQRQLKAIRRMVQAGPEGFTGGMSTKKYTAITNCSRATATRDLTQLTEWNALHKTGEGRGVRYWLGRIKTLKTTTA